MVYLETRGHRGAFYQSAGIRYGEQVLGINKIKGLMKEITGQADLVGNFTKNLRYATVSSWVDEQEIMSRTGHRSFESTFGSISVQILY